MDALFPSPGLLVRAGRKTWRDQLARQGVGLLLVLLLGAALTLGFRRLTGALERPLAAPMLAAAAVALAAISSLLHLASRRLWPTPAGRWLEVSIVLGLLVAGLALSLPGSSPAGMAFFWLVLATAETATRAPWRSRPDKRVESHVADRTSLHSHTHVESVPARSDLSAGDEGLSQGTLQQITRTRSDEGVEAVEGRLGVELAAGQRTATAHVAFCPPFARVPRIEVAVDGEEARVKLAQALPHGARFDVKLNAPAEEPLVLPLRFSATCAP
ncbi:MAG: hypothetical protein KF708_05730 [Pirellulales bacterium]|nr:hypothetical protein [Pirellulales bacterium]